MRKYIKFPRRVRTFQQACAYIAPLIAQGYKVVIWSFEYDGSATLAKTT